MKSIGAPGIARFVDRLLVKSLAYAVVVVLALWFANLPTYLNLVHGFPMTQVHWVLLTAALMLVHMFARDAWNGLLSMPLVVWWCVVVSMNLLWFIGGGGGDAAVLSQRFLALGFFAISYLYLASFPELVVALRRSMMWLALMAVACSAYDITHPFTFIPAGSEFANLGRAAGFYVNPNLAGAAIVLAMTLSMGMVPERWRGPYIAMCAMGVTLSFSRAAMLVFVIACVGMLWSKVLSWRSARVALSLLAIVIACLVTLLWSAVSELLSSDAMNRLLWFMSPSDGADFSQNERQLVAEQGLAQFVESPLLGNGVGSTETWSLRASTHNQYIQFLSDFGILGLFIVPALAAVIGWSNGSSGTQRVVAVIILFFCMATHNMLTEYYWLVALAVAATLRTGSSPVVGAGSAAQ